MIIFTKLMILSVIFYFVALFTGLEADFSDLKELRGLELFYTILKDFVSIAILLGISILLFNIILVRFNIK